MFVTGPAWKSGIIREGDLLFEVDGSPVTQCTTSRVTTYLLGPKGTHITMVYLRGKEKIVANLTREIPVDLRWQGIPCFNSGTLQYA
jgi:C-terminal processing protease CtpA/Prc